METTCLSGIKAICEYCRQIGIQSSESSVLLLIRDEGLPAKKLGGIWDSDKVKIDQWRRKRLDEEKNAGIPPTPAKKSGKK